MSSHEPVRLGVVGVGMISEQYLPNLTQYPDVKLVALGDMDLDRAREKAERYGVGFAGSAEDVIGHPDVEIVVNLTVPLAHADVALSALAAGKHVWNEKPITTDRDSARRLLEAASQAGLRVGVAPDSILAPGFQAAKRAIERGSIGELLSAQTCLQYAGPDIFHANPPFYFTEGGGPVLDMGPYYLSALVALFGPIARVAAVGTTGRRERTIRVGERTGETFPVTVPTTVSVLAEFDSGKTAQCLFSFESPLTRMGVFEATGTEGTMILHNPNKYAGPVKIARIPEGATSPLEQAWEDVAVDQRTFGRGVGIVEMARAIRNGGPQVASGELAYHVLDVMIAISESIESRGFVSVESRFTTVPSLPETWDPFAATV